MKRIDEENELKDRFGRNIEIRQSTKCMHPSILYGGTSRETQHVRRIIAWPCHACQLDKTGLGVSRYRSGPRLATGNSFHAHKDYVGMTVGDLPEDLL